jgi:hypothetical protein
VYFVSEVLAGSKKYFFEIEKICYTIIMSSRKLDHYFEAHNIRVLTNQLLHDIFHNRDGSDRIGKWATELLEYIINFERRNAIESQILADFMAEWTVPQIQTDTMQNPPWLIYCDGAWGSTGAGVVAILTSPSGIKLRYAARLQFTNGIDKCTNNIVEYKGILLGLQKLRAIACKPTCSARTPNLCQDRLKKDASQGSQL